MSQQNLSVFPQTLHKHKDATCCHLFFSQPLPEPREPRTCENENTLGTSLRVQRWWLWRSAVLVKTRVGVGWGAQSRGLIRIFDFFSADQQTNIPRVFCARKFTTCSFLGWVYAARGSKLAPRSRKNFPYN